MCAKPFDFFSTITCHFVFSISVMIIIDLQDLNLIKYPICSQIVVGDKKI
jgi:hypothetical protein